MNLEEEEKPPQDRSAYNLDPYEMDRAIVELRDDLEHELQVKRDCSPSSVSWRQLAERSTV